MGEAREARIPDPVSRVVALAAAAQWAAVFTIHATKKLLDRVKHPIQTPVQEPSTVLGNWYGTALFWRPQQVALLLNERTLLPVLMPLAPASSLMQRFPGCVAEVLEGLGAPPQFVEQEVAAMSQGAYARTASRSMLGVMNSLARVACWQRADGLTRDLAACSLLLAQTPCAPLYERHVSPDREVLALVDQQCP